MNKLMVALFLSSALVGPAFANCGNGPNDGGNGCNNDGPAGPQGQPGVAGQNGADGKDGAVGATGVQGPNHTDPRMTEARFGCDTALRLYDGKRVQLQAYNIWSPSLHRSEDAVGDGRNLQFGVRFVFKLGSSYEERLLEAQNRKIAALEAALSRLQ